MDRQPSATVNDADTMRGASGGTMGKRFRLVIILVCLLAGAAQAQWLDTTLYLGVGRGPCSLVYDSVSNKTYCANRGSNNVSVIDGVSNQVIATVVAGLHPWALCYNPQDNKVYCANNAISSVTVIDGASNQVDTTIGAGTTPGLYAPTRRIAKSIAPITTAPLRSLRFTIRVSPFPPCLDFVVEPFSLALSAFSAVSF